MLPSYKSVFEQLHTLKGQENINRVKRALFEAMLQETYANIMVGDLTPIWEKYGGIVELHVDGSFFLYVGQTYNMNDHIHLFYNNGRCEYNIKCHGSSGNSRTKYTIMNTNLDTIVQEMLSNWHKHSPDGCGEYFNQIVKTGKKTKKR